MKEINKIIYVVSCNGKETEKETLKQAQQTVEFLKEVTDITTFTIEQRNKTVYEMEKGDKVYWLKNGIPDTSRVDIITDIVRNDWGDKQFLTKEIDGHRIGSAYESYITPVLC